KRRLLTNRTRLEVLLDKNPASVTRAIHSRRQQRRTRLVARAHVAVGSGPALIAHTLSPGLGRRLSTPDRQRGAERQGTVLASESCGTLSALASVLVAD